MKNFNMIPLEIMLEILSRVPTETVLECKLVSKPWRNQLQHPTFSQIHLNRLNDLDSADDSGKLSLLMYDESNTKPYCYTEYDEKLNRFTRTTRINLRPPFKDCSILGSCNRLICFTAYMDQSYQQPVYTCNPITREYIVLPTLEGKNLLFGFGYSPSTNEYKVVRICKGTGNTDYGIIQVYTLGSGIGWRKGKKMDYDVASLRAQGMFVNGSIHWLNPKGTIVALDLANEEVRVLPSLPCLQLPTPRIVDLHVLGDYLCVHQYSFCKYITIWVLKNRKSNPDMIWSKEFSNVEFHAMPITITTNGELLCCDCHDKNVYLYRPKASSSRMIVSSGKNFTGGVCHKNTLVSLRALGEEDTKLMNLDEEQDVARDKEVILSQRSRRRKRSLNEY